MAPQLIALIAFAAIVLLLSLGMWPVTRTMDGSQKYRQRRRAGPDLDPTTKSRGSMSAVQSALAALFGYGVANTSQDTDDGGESTGGDDGGSGGGDGGGD